MDNNEFEEIKKVLPKEIFDADFAEEAMKQLKDLFEDLESDSEEKREKAKEMLDEYEKAREIIGRELTEMFNKSDDELKELLGDQDNYSEQEWKSIREGIDLLKPLMEGKPYEEPPVNPPKKIDNQWIKS